MFSKIISWIKSIFSSNSTPVSAPTTEPSHTITIGKWGYIVPHTKDAQGATSPSGESEYEYGMRLSAMLGVPSATRDSAGVSGAAKDLVARGCTMTLEDHKNAYNGKAKGLEILVMKGDDASEKEARRLVDIFVKHVNELTIRGNFGIKFVSSGDRGYGNLKAARQLADASLLVEAFFIDNKDDYIEKEKLAAIYNEFFVAENVDTVDVEEEEPTSVSEGKSKALWDRNSLFGLANIYSLIETYLLDLNPSDIKNYCPTFDELTKGDKILFWEYFLSCMAYKESGLKPSTTYKENFKDSNGNYVISTGLFQLSVESVNGYNKFGTPRVEQADLFDSETNLLCALVILNRWISKDGVISSSRNEGGARYWSVLRSNSNHEWIKGKCLEAWS